ncbi:hypothetical protein QJQ45_019281, partial [Haematococcus lacustris]
LSVQILDIKTETPDLINALATLSSFQTDNTPAARRGLRSTIEQRSLDINDTFLKAAEAVIQALDNAQSKLDGLSTSCSKVNQVLGSTKEATSQLLGETERLQRELEGVERKAQLVTDFLEHYQLSPEETAALQGQEVGPPFFAALSRVRQIHDNCRTLLRTNHQRAGLELMELMANYQEMAYDRLCRCVLNGGHMLWLQARLSVGGVLQAAVRTLAERPVLFKYCAEEVITARQTALFQRFITALTRGGPGGMPRPMELHAHDPQRYINDMLAWVHQTLAGEREFVVALFGDGAPSGSATERSAGTRPGASSGGGVHEQARAHSGKDNGTIGTSDNLAAGEGLGAAALLDRIFESICRPLRVRIEQVLMTTPPLLLCYQLAQLHSFYLALVTPILGPGAQLVQTLAACRSMALRVFMEQIRARGDKLVRSPPAPPKDLSAPPQLLEAVHGMLEVVRAHESALGAGAAPPGIQGVAGTDADKDGNVGGGEELGPILAAMLDPIVEACQLSAEALLPDAPSRVDPVNSSARGAAGPWGALDPRARHVYLMNCLAHMATALGRHPCAAPRVQQLLGSVEGHVSALVGLEAGRLLSRCGLADVSARLRLYRQHSAGGQGSGGRGGDGVAGGVQGAAGEALGAAGPASDPALAYPLVVDALRSFFVLVSSPDVLPEFRDIQVSGAAGGERHALARLGLGTGLHEAESVVTTLMWQLVVMMLVAHGRVPGLLLAEPPRLRAEACTRVGQALAEAFESVYAALDDPTTGYAEQGGSASVRHTPGQLRTILGVL